MLHLSLTSAPLSMDPKLLLCSPRASHPYPSPHTLPRRRFPPHSSKIALSRATHLRIRTKSHAPTPFLGERLNLDERRREIHLRCRPISAAVKRRKEMPFDNVIQRDKKLKLVLKIRRLLVNQPDRVMGLKELGKYRRDLGLTRKRRFIALLKRFPAVFEILEEGVYSLKFRLTPEAERIYLEELRLRNEMEDIHVVKLRKLLMMSPEKRILIEKIAHLKGDLGLPMEFKDTICQRYPQYFKVVRTDRGPALELTHWDPALAVSDAEVHEEENRIREMEDRNLIIDRPTKFKRVKLPRGLNLSKGEMRRISQFRDMPYISPYSDFSELRAGTHEKEKHGCGVVHEILSLTVEKKTLVDHLTHFREEFRFSQQLRGMLIRHPDMFYVSLKGDRDSVFLREAYHDSQLIEKDRMLILKEKMRALVSVPRFGRRRMEGVAATGTDEGGEEAGNDEDVEEWYDDNSLQDGLSDDFDEDEGDYDEEDYWSDEDDETPPDFDDGESLGFKQTKPHQSVGLSLNNPVRDRIPVLPDGRQRERW